MNRKRLMGNMAMTFAPLVLLLPVVAARLQGRDLARLVTACLAEYRADAASPGEKS